MSLVFEWDPRKARANLRKHRVSFAEAASVFGDPLARIFEDQVTPMGTARVHHRPFDGKEASVGMFSERVKDQVRIISARCATRGEQHD